MKAVLLSKDLMFISRIKEVAAACGGEVVVVKNQAALEQAIGTSGTVQSGVVLLDLEKCPIALEVVEKTVAGLSKDLWRCVSFFSHIHLETADEARRRGLGEVMPRSRFVQLLPGLFGA